MKNLKILMFGILLVGMCMTSCKKDADQQFQNAGNQQAQQDARTINKEKLFERTLTVFNADKTKSTTLRFRTGSKDLLDKIPLDNIEFTLVKNPESATKAAGVDAPAISDNAGYSSFSGKDASPAQGMNENQVMPKDGIQIDLPNLAKTESVSLQVKSKNFNKGPAPAATYYKFYFISGWHKIQVTNYYSTPISVYFYFWDNSKWNFSGFSFTLYNGGWVRYWNCNHTVGAGVYYQYYHSYTVYFWPHC